MALSSKLCSFCCLSINTVEEDHADGADFHQRCCKQVWRFCYNRCIADVNGKCCQRRQKTHARFLCSESAGISQTPQQSSEGHVEFSFAVQLLDSINQYKPVAYLNGHDHSMSLGVPPPNK